MKRNTKIFILALWFIILGCTKNEIIQEKDELFKLNVEFEDLIPIYEKINMKLYETKNSKQVGYEGKIERRGGFSISFPKHSYEIDLAEDISLAGMAEDDDWIINANYIDKTLLRHVLSYEIFSVMSDINIAAKSQFIELELNGEYNGLYVLMEKLDKSSLGIAASDDLAMIFKEPHIFRESYDGIIPQNPDNFHQQTYPKIENEDKRSCLEEIRKFILTSTNNEFQSDISDIFDMNNIIDWHLLLLISNNNDGILKNFYLYKIDKETPIRVAPWDYDHSFGRDGDNELNLDERPLIAERSILFKRLLDFEWYRTNLKDRWQELNNMNILSVSGLKQRIHTKCEIIKDPAKKNFEIWSVESPWYYDSNNFEQEIEIMLEFIDLRHSRLREYFDNL